MNCACDEVDDDLVYTPEDLATCAADAYARGVKDGHARALRTTREAIKMLKRHLKNAEKAG